MQRAKGQLEAELLSALRDADTPLSVKELQARLNRPTPAVTTIITVLERMRSKELVDRAASGGRSYQYFPTRSRVDQATVSIQHALELAGDRHAALLLLAGTLTDDDREVLRGALKSNNK